ELDPANTTRDDIDIQGTVGHEIGHSVKGLGHPNAELVGVPFQIPGTCKDSIMNPGEPYDPKRSPDANTVHPRDVEMAKKRRDHQKDCTATAGKELNDTSVGGPDWPVTYEAKTQEESCRIRWRIAADFRTDEGVLEFVGWDIVIEGVDCF